jgi:predicted HAD superfamily Cof-like phosphohydrolase
MTPEQRAVTEFMLRAEQECPVRPTIPGHETRLLRLRLIDEELGELSSAQATENMTEVADALGDLLYVVLGTASAYGLDMEPIFWEIHRSNLSKFIDGHKREDGKWIKGPSYSPANLAPIWYAQS